MSVLNIRDFPKDLRLKLKARAAERDMSLQRLVVVYLEESLKRDTGPGKKGQKGG